jgi:hypothetical protein
LEAKVPGTDTTVKQHPHDELGKGAVVEGGDGNVKSGEEAYGETVEQKEKAKETGRGLANEGVDQAQRCVVPLLASFDS